MQLIRYSDEDMHHEVATWIGKCLSHGIPECVEDGHYAPYRGLSVSSHHGAVNGAFRERVWQGEIVNARLWSPRKIDFRSRCEILCPGVKPPRVRRISRCRFVKVNAEMVFARPENTELIVPIRIGYHAASVTKLPEFQVRLKENIGPLSPRQCLARARMLNCVEHEPSLAEGFRVWPTLRRPTPQLSLPPPPVVYAAAST